MKKIKKADVIIVSVLLLIIIGIVLMVSRGGGNGSSGAKDGGDPASAGAASSQSGDLSYTDYNGKKIGILTGTNMEAESFKYFPDSEYLYYDGYPNMNMALLNGSIDAYLGDEPALKSIHAEQPDIDYIKNRLTDNQYSFAFRKNEESETKLRDQLNAFLAKCQTDGTHAEIDSIWFGIDDSKKVVDLSGLTGENGTVHVVTTSTDEPFSYIKNGKHVGYDIDVTARFCKEYGYALEIGDVDFQARIPALASGKYEFTTSMNVTPEREEEVMFSNPVSSGGIVVAVRSEDLADAAPALQGEPSYTEFNGRCLGIRTGSNFESITLKYFPDSEYSYFDSDSDLLVALKSNKIDAFLDDEPVAAMIHQEQKDTAFIKKPIVGDDYCFGFQKDTKRSNKLRNEFNEILAELRSSGELDKMKDKWINGTESEKTFDGTGLTGENGKLTVVVVPDNVPFSYTANNELVGYAIELVTIFARRYGYSIEFEETNLAGSIAGLTAGKYDILAGSLSYTEERAKSMDFSDVIYNGGVVLVARASDLQGASGGNSGAVEDRPLSYYAENGKIGAITGGLYEVELNKRYPDAEILQYNAQPDLAIALSEGKIDAFTCPLSSAKDFMAADSSLTYLNEVFMKIPYGFAFKKADGTNELRDQMNAFLAKLQADGTYVVCILADSSQLERSLFMLADYAGLSAPCFLVLNMADVAKERGKKIDVTKIEQKLGIPVMQFSATDTKAYDTFYATLDRALQEKPQAFMPAVFLVCFRSGAAADGIISDAVRRFVELPVYKIIVGTASSGAVCPHSASGAAPGQQLRGKPSVIREAVGAFPDAAEGLLPQVSLDKTRIIQGFAPPDIADTVNADRRNARKTSPEKSRSAAISAQPAVSF